MKRSIFIVTYYAKQTETFVLGTMIWKHLLYNDPIEIFLLKMLLLHEYRNIEYIFSFAILAIRKVNYKVKPVVMYRVADSPCRM